MDCLVIENCLLEKADQPAATAQAAAAAEFPPD